MRKKLVALGVGIVLCLSLSVPVFADSTMKWKFELYNNSYAEQTALNIAQAQKSLEEKKKAYWEKTPEERFMDILTRQIEYRLAKKIVDELFGEGELTSGHYTVGELEIDIYVDEVVTIIITNTTTGNTTKIELPYYNYSGIG